jgi:hypothetical protein
MGEDDRAKDPNSTKEMSKSSARGCAERARRYPQRDGDRSFETQSETH